MKKIKMFWTVTLQIVILVGVMALMTVFTKFVSDTDKLFYIHLLLTVASGIAMLLLSEKQRKDVGSFIARLAEQLSLSQQEALRAIPVPVAVIGKKGELVWYNEAFGTDMINGDAHGALITKVNPRFDLKKVLEEQECAVRWDKKWFLCVSSELSGDDAGKYALYFQEITELKQIEARYNKSRPTIMIIVFDNEEELFKARESERMRVTSAVDALINDWVGSNAGICWADARDKSLVIIEESVAQKLIDEKFTLLEAAHEIVVEDGTPVTLSIGIGRGGNDIEECEEWALQALDMALGRGGDQAVIHTPEGYSFIGGTSKSSERQSKVRIRMLANSLTEIINECDNCIIMGHTHSDLDAIGAAIGVYSIVRHLGKEVFITVDRKESMANSLISYYNRTADGEVFLDPFDALDYVGENTLVIIVDTNAKKLVESKPLYERANNIVVIDHHRMVVDYIDNSRLFIHEPYASSTCEIISELAGYIDERVVGRTEAEAMLSGIMLDSKNFVVNTGVRTFEASAFLRKRGADTVEVKRLFDESLDTYAAKARTVANATVHNNCAVSVVENAPNVRVIASQAADDMLAISDVYASFVVFEADDMVNISARSFGKINVQIIMERLGGGGHLTSAAVQLKDTTVSKAINMLYEAIDK